MADEEWLLVLDTAVGSAAMDDAELECGVSDEEWLLLLDTVVGCATDEEAKLEWAATDELLDTVEAFDELWLEALAELVLCVVVCAAETVVGWATLEDSELT